MRKGKRTVLAAAFGSIFLGGPANSLGTVDEALEMLDGDEVSQVAVVSFLMGAQIGMMWVNTFNEDNGYTPPFCVPIGLELTPGQVVSIFKNYAEDNPHIGWMPPGVTFYDAMKSTFPCKD